jgi:hypothetical protein
LSTFTSFCANDKLLHKTRVSMAIKILSWFIEYEKKVGYKYKI